MKIHKIFKEYQQFKVGHMNKWNPVENFKSL